MKTRKEFLSLYWEWKLHHTALSRIVERENISVYKLKEIFDKFDYEFEMTNWVPRYV